MPRPGRARAKRRQKAAKAAKAAKVRQSADVPAPADPTAFAPLPFPSVLPAPLLEPAARAADVSPEIPAESGEDAAPAPTSPRYRFFLDSRRRWRRDGTIPRFLIYMGVGIALAAFVFYVINSMETSDRAPKAIISEP
jgi:hypothetical protein